MTDAAIRVLRALEAACGLRFEVSHGPPAADQQRPPSEGGDMMHG